MPPKLLNKAEQAMFQNWDSACAALHIPSRAKQPAGFSSRLRASCGSWRAATVAVRVPAWAS